MLPATVAAMPELIEARATMDLDIGVIYTHERDLILRLLPSLRASAPGYCTRLILVDNASRDGVGRWLPLYPECRVLTNTTRHSYAENLNR
ncbi:MAG: glycosyltransferase family 2 protein, partial [Planctomycetota bacterium]